MPYTDFVIPREFELAKDRLPELHRTLAGILGVSVEKMKANFIKAEESVVGDKLDGPPVLEARMQVIAGRPSGVLEQARTELMNFIRGAVRRCGDGLSAEEASPRADTLVVEVSFMHVLGEAHGKETLRFDQVGAKQS